jgi:hypothetical protein
MRSHVLDHVIVSVETPERARLWTAEFDISLPSLELAIDRAGNRFSDIREELGMARIYFFPRDDRTNQRLLQRGLALS